MPVGTVGLVAARQEARVSRARMTEQGLSLREASQSAMRGGERRALSMLEARLRHYDQIMGVRRGDDRRDVHGEYKSFFALRRRDDDRMRAGRSHYFGTNKRDSHRKQQLRELERQVA